MTERDVLLWAVDGIEEGVARLEDEGGGVIRLPQSLLPSGAKEGQLLRVTRSAGKTKGSLVLTIAIDDEATAAALARSRAAVRHASAASKKRDRGGDVAL